MCWCRPEVRTPCCGSDACHEAGGVDPDKCPFCTRPRRQDAPRPAPGTSDGPNRYGRPAGSEAPAVGMPPIPFEHPHASAILCGGGRMPPSIPMR